MFCRGSTGDLPRDCGDLPLKILDPHRHVFHGRMRRRTIDQQGIATLLKFTKPAVEVEPFRVVDHRLRWGVSLRWTGWLRLRSCPGCLLAECLQAVLALSVFVPRLFGRLMGLVTGPCRAMLPIGPPILHVVFGPGVGCCLGTGGSSSMAAIGTRTSLWRPWPPVGQRRPWQRAWPCAAVAPNLFAPTVDDDRGQTEHHQTERRQHPAGRPRPHRPAFPSPNMA